MNKEFKPIQTDEDNQIRISIKEYKEKEYLDIRKWWKPEGNDDYVPTKVGLNFNVDDTLDSVDMMVKMLVNAYCILHETEVKDLNLEEFELND